MSELHNVVISISVDKPLKVLRFSRIRITKDFSVKPRMSGPLLSPPA